jgi:hypothetical protein
MAKKWRVIMKFIETADGSGWSDTTTLVLADNAVDAIRYATEPVPPEAAARCYDIHIECLTIWPRQHHGGTDALTCQP